MKAEEIMLGDLLTFGECVNDKEFPVIRITGILDDTLFATVDDDRANDELDYEGLVGIPLTPEILEKNGFRWTGSGDSTGMLSTPWGFDGIRYNIYVGLKKKTIEVHSAHPELRTDSWRKVNKVSLEVCGCFVHELQHALRLCGINLEIKI